MNIPSRCIGMAASVVLLAAVARSRAAEDYGVAEVAGGVASPVFVTGAPHDYRRVFVVSRKGTIRILDTGSVPYSLQPAASAFLNISALLPTSADERGLLGLAFHPRFGSSGKFYVYYAARPLPNSPTSARYYCTVAEYTVRDPVTHVVEPGLNQADPASARVVIQIPHPAETSHNGGWIAFGPDGYLYISVGDGGDANDTGAGHNPEIGNAQDTGVALGKILRIDVDITSTPAQGPLAPGAIASYGIPPDNPVIAAPPGATGSRREIWAYGIRNAFRNSFDRLTGDLYIADVGQDAWEELNYQPALTAANHAQVAGRNYGWRCREGLDDLGLSGQACAGLALTDPVAVYAHNQPVPLPPSQIVPELNTGCSIIGGYVYRGCAIPSLRGKYVVTDFCSGRVLSLSMSDGVVTGRTSIPSVRDFSQVSFGEDSYGELYLCDHTLGRVFKYVPMEAGRPVLANCDFDRSGTVNVNDLLEFLPAWFTKAPAGDFNGNPQSSAGVTVQDVFEFLKCVTRRCPGGQ